MAEKPFHPVHTDQARAAVGVAALPRGAEVEVEAVMAAPAPA